VSGLPSPIRLAPAAHNSGNWQWANRCIGVVVNAAEPSTPDAEAQLTAMTTDGFTINWVNPTSQPWIIHYLALGGPDITSATVGTFTPAANVAPETPEDEAIAVGFQPDFLMFLAINSTTTPTRASPDGKLTLGYAAGPNGSITQGTHAVLSRTAGANISASGVQSHYDAIVEVIPGSTPPLPFVAAVKSFDANGFTITKKINYSPYTPVHYLALRGGRYKVGQIFRPATEGASSQSVTAVGFTPHGLLFSAWGEIQSDGTLAPLFNIDPIKDEGARINFSAVDGAISARATFFEEVTENGSDNDRSWVKQGTWGNATTSSKTIYLTQGGDCQEKWVPPEPSGNGGPMCYEPAGGGRVITDADLASYDASGFTLNWTTNDFQNANYIAYPLVPPPNAGDGWAAEIFYVAFGPSFTTEAVVLHRPRGGFGGRARMADGVGARQSRLPPLPLGFRGRSLDADHAVPDPRLGLVSGRGPLQLRGHGPDERSHILLPARGRGDHRADGAARAGLRDTNGRCGGR
jgi:hypothetical protein